MSILDFFDSNGQNQSGTGDMARPNKSESALSRLFWLIVTAAIFLGANYIVDVYLVGTPSKLDNMQREMDDRFDDMQEEMGGRFDNMQGVMDGRFDNVQTQFGNVQTQIDGLQREVSERMKGFDSQLSSVNNRLDTLNDNISRTSTNIYREMDEVRALLANVSTTPVE